MRKSVYGFLSLLWLTACTSVSENSFQESFERSYASKPLPSVLPYSLSLNGLASKETREVYLHALTSEEQNAEYTLTSTNNRQYTVQVQYKKLPDNRSFPSHLDITLKDESGQKLGYLFFAINHIAYLKQVGEFGLLVNDDGHLVDVRLSFNKVRHGDLSIDDLMEERFIQDTLMPSKGFQMIRPVVLEPDAADQLSKHFSLDAHPFEVEYRVKTIADGVVQFQHNLYRVIKGRRQLIERIYYNADSIDTLREGMYAAKYYDPEYGTIKLVYYPAMGQTQTDPQFLQ